MIKFLVTGQQLKIVTPIVVADTHNYQTAQAVFRGEEWAPCTKWAHFIKDDAEYLVPFHSDEITTDQGLDLTAGTWQVYIHGNEYDAETDSVATRITTSTALLKVEAAEAENPFPPITPSLTEVLAAEVENALQVAQGVRQDAASGAFNGATFTPMVTETGELSWTNDKGLKNPATVQIKGAPGEPGADFQILGYYDTVEALETAVTDPYPGDAYGIGAEQPYDIYIFDAVNSIWRNNGPVQGAKGDPGESATVEVSSVETVPFDQGAKVENVGTPSAAKLVFSIPSGKTPVKGEDYWTEDDIKDIGASISPASIGAIADPDTKATGNFLQWDGEKWIASAVTAGVSTVNGKSGAVVTRLIFENKTLAASAFSKQSSPAYPDFPYVASLALSGVTTAMTPIVNYAPAEQMSGNFCPSVDVYTGGIYIYAHEKPASNITIPTIIVVA